MNIQDLELERDKYKAWANRFRDLLAPLAWLDGFDNPNECEKAILEFDSKESVAASGELLPYFKENKEFMNPDNDKIAALKTVVTTHWESKDEFIDRVRKIIFKESN
jgi:hypothetical protein